MKKVKVGVLGATGMVGQQFIRMLEDHPYFELAEVFASERSARKKYEDAASWSITGNMPDKARPLIVKLLTKENIVKSNVKILFSGIPAAVAKELEYELRSAGLFIFTNASSSRMDWDVPILIPEVNHQQIELVKIQKKQYSGFIIAGSNCSTAGLVMALYPLLKFNIDSVVVNTFQAISGAGKKGVFAMDILGNVIPFIKSEEDKMMKETKKILGVFKNGKIEEANFDVYANCSRVPVHDGHLESLVVKFKNKVKIDEIKNTLSGFKSEPQTLRLPTAPEIPIIYNEQDNRPQPLPDAMNGTPKRAAGMAVTVGRIRVEDKVLRMFLLVNNTIRGAAGNCILNAEYAYVKKLFN